MNKLVTDLIDKEHVDNEQETSETKTEEFALKTSVLAFASRPKAKARPPRPTSACSSTTTLPICERRWTDIEPGTQSDQAYPVAKRFNTLLRHGHLPREEDGAIWKMIFETNLTTLNIGLKKSGRVQWQKAEETRKDFNIVLIHQDKKFFISELFKVIQDAIPIDPTLQDNVFVPNDFFEYICHIGCAVSVHSVTKSGLTAGGQNSSKDRQTVFFTAVNPLNKDHRDPQDLDPTKPRLASFKQKWKRHQDTVHWVDFQLAQRKGLRFYQTRCNAIILYYTLPAYCISKVVVMGIWRSHVPESVCVTSTRQKFLIKMIGWKDWFQE